MVSLPARSSLGLFSVCSLILLSASPPSLAQETAVPTPAGSSAKQSNGKPPDLLFQKLDKNHDKKIDKTELASPDVGPYRSKLEKADRNRDGMITKEEFDRADEVPFYSDPLTLAALFLIAGFASFCLFLDGLLEPDRRDYFLLAIGGSVLCVGLAYLFGSRWFLGESPYLAFVAVAPAVLIVLALITGVTQAQEEQPVVPSGETVYKVGKTPSTSGTASQKPAQQPRRAAPPVRTPRPAPMPRPEVPERRPSAAPRPSPPRPSGPSLPPAGPKPPPGKK